MRIIKDFFNSIDFSFYSDIKQKEISIPENSELPENIKNNIYVYDSPENANTSFYLIPEPITEKELFEIKRYFWNENKYELYFRTDAKNIKLCYAKNSPREDEIELDTFKLTESEKAKIEKIKKWKFESGAFWMDYIDALDKIKRNQSIDEKLINQLKQLKIELSKVLRQTANKLNDDIVQALIDRMLFIKFLEDNHIINSYFYKHFFNNKDLSYKQLLEERDVNNINLLYKKINDIFSNLLFETPIIEEQYVNKTSNLLYKTIKQDDLITGQLSLFDFRFDVIPIEFISHIYEVFLKGKQADEGIFYTPPKLAQLIVDDVITKQGKILDPACGSGMFLILAFRKLLDINPINQNLSVSEKINYKINILKKHIFGIEKENTAWRLTIFSLYLEILKGLPNEEIKEFIKQKIEKENDIEIFPDFSKNIINGNSLEIKKENLHFVNQTFDYIVGNPPFLQLSPDAEEISFINNYSTEINEKKIKAIDVVGYKQISQVFMLKIKDWANENTKFGFVLNSSNFYNEKSDKFQKFFFENYQVENFYELSRVKKILFKKAKESVIVAIFNNKKVDNKTFNYYPVDLEIFSETFNLLVIQEDKRIEIKQKDIPEKQVVLRDYLIGNEFDLKLLAKLKNNSKILENFILDDKYYGLAVGLRITGSDKIKSENKSYKNLSKEEQNIEFKKIKESFISRVKNDTYTLPYIEYKDINAFKVFINKFLDEDDLLNNKYRRNKKLAFFSGEKILLRKIPRKNFEAIYNSQTLCFPDGVFSIRLKNNTFYYLFTALLNSDIISYYINLVFLKRKSGSFPHISVNVINNIPIPKELDENLVIEISETSKQLTKGKLQYEGETKEKLNNLIYDLYDLSYLERQRIKDFFSTKIQADKNDLKKYEESLYYSLEMYFDKKPQIRFYEDKTLGFNLRVAAVYFNDSYKTMPSEQKVFKYQIKQILKTEKFITMREKIFGKNCVYIIKDKHFKNWSETKGFEDAKFILKKLS